MLPRLLLAVALLVTACADDRPAPKQRPGSWTVELSTAPTLLALTAEQAYAASYGNGVGGSQVYRVDRGTGRLSAQRTVAGQPHGLAVAPNGELWLATLQLPDQQSGTGLQVLDPLTLQTRRSLPVDGVPLSIAFVDGRLWVGDGGGASLLDPADGRVLRRVALPHPAQRLLPAPAGLVAVGPAALSAIDPATGRVTATRSVPASGSTTATAGQERIWVVHPDADDRSVLRPYDPTSLAPGPPAASPGRAGAGAVVAGEDLWDTDPGGGRLLCADAATGRVRDEWAMTLTGPVTADEISVLAAQPTGLVARPAACGSAD